MAGIEEIEGIGPTFGAQLKAVGIATVESLLTNAATRAQREDLAAKTGIDKDKILEWANRADLFRVKGIGSEYSDLLEAAGVDTVPELAGRNAENLHEALARTNESKHLVRQLPTLEDVRAWIEHARQLPKVITY
jgi:predicted flap endonuclease-1-like 5' DNA nuclease